MITPCFRSFQETPIVLLTECVNPGLPGLAHDSVQATLRDVWLSATVRDRWFVGPYWILPDRVSLLACPGRRASAAALWAVRWKTEATHRINLTTGGGPLWGDGTPPVPVESEADYEAKIGAMRAEAARLLDPFCASRFTGILWQIL